MFFTITPIIIRRFTRGAVLLLLLPLLVPALGFAQTWDYKAVKKGRNGESEVQGTLTLDDKGETIVILGPGGACHGRPLPVKVARDADTITIEQTEALPGCERMRFVIRADGTGGSKEVLRGDQWVRSKSEPGLTLKR